MPSPLLHTQPEIDDLASHANADTTDGHSSTVTSRLVMFLIDDGLGGLYPLARAYCQTFGAATKRTYNSIVRMV